MSKGLRILALFLLGGTLGVLLGIYLVRKFSDKEKAMGMWSEEVFFDSFAKKEFAYADPQNAREALQYAIRIHNEMRTTSPLWGWSEKRDLGLCYGELSLLEESAGNKGPAEDYMAQAQQALREAGLKDTSEAHIRTLSERRLSIPRSSGGPR